MWWMIIFRYPFTLELSRQFRRDTGDFLIDSQAASYSGNVFDEYPDGRILHADRLERFGCLALSYAGQLIRGASSPKESKSAISMPGSAKSIRLVSPTLVSYLESAVRCFPSTFTHSSPSSYYRIIASNTPVSNENSTRKSVENPGYRFIHLIGKQWGKNTFANSDYAS
jgi:hypothetical protein